MNGQVRSIVSALWFLLTYGAISVALIWVAIMGRFPAAEQEIYRSRISLSMSWLIPTWVFAAFAHLLSLAVTSGALPPTARSTRMRALLSTLSAIVALLVGYTNVPSLVYRWNEGLLGPATMWVIVTVSAVNAVLATLVCVTLVVMVSRRAQLAAVMLLMLPYRDTRAARPRPMAATSALGCCVGAAAAVVYGVPGKDGTGSLIPGS